MFSIFVREVTAFLNSLIAYIVMAAFLTAMGLLLWVFPDTNVLDYGFADMSTFFYFAPYVFMFLIPAITMRSFAEEKRTGTIELLLTKPLREWEIILGKFFASWALVLLTLLPTLVYYYSLDVLGTVPIRSPQGEVLLSENIDAAGIFASYIGLLLLGGVFCAIGLLSSSLSRDQITAFVIGVFLCFTLFIGFSSIAKIRETADWAFYVMQMGIDYHYYGMSKGLIDLRSAVYLLSVAALMLLFTKLIINSRKW